MNSIIDAQRIPHGSILGLNYSGMHDTAIAIVSGQGDPIFAVSLERVSRRKQDGRWPGPLLEAIPWDRIESVAVSVDQTYSPLGEDYVSKIHPLPLRNLDSGNRSHGAEFLQALESISREKTFVPHHLSHASSSFWGAGFTDALCLVYDGGMCNESWFGGVYQASTTDGISPIDQFSALHYANITYLYSIVTAVLGFTPLKHEGKITGLAAFGRATSACREVLEQWLMEPERIHGLFRWEGMYDKLAAPMLRVDIDLRARLKHELGQFSREDVAATVQEMAERHVLDILGNIQRQGALGKNICLSGGLFANVKINQRVSRFGFENIFIAPPMTDDGAALGAAWQLASRLPGFRPHRLTSMYLGPAENPSDSRDVVEKLGIKYTAPGDHAKAIATRLAAGKIVAIFVGASEFGPRALGNRSILAPATESNVNQTLNARLDRTEFMPFAPIVRAEDAAEYFNIQEGEKHACQFMTLTVDCTERAKQDCPAVVHVDRTARPQLVTGETNPLVYQVLGEYQKLTGKMALVNTSFNIHEEPIVCSVEDALRGFFEAGLDCLYVEGVGVVELEGNEVVQVKYLRSKIKSQAESLHLSQDQIAELSQRSRVLDASLAAHGDKLARCEGELRTAHEAIGVLGGDNQKLQNEVEALGKELQGLYASKSWRYTLPLRKTMSGVKWISSRLRQP
jgi:carbamoyltransferase